jgi:hypothetical protein
MTGQHGVDEDSDVAFKQALRRIVNAPPQKAKKDLAQEAPVAHHACMYGGWSVVVHRHAQGIERDMWDCAISDPVHAEDAVRHQYPSQSVLVAASEPLTTDEIADLGLMPGEIRKRESPAGL